MPRFLILEDVRETRKYVVEAASHDAAVTAWETAQEAGDAGSFVGASRISIEVQQLDDAGNVIEITPLETD